MLLLFHYPAGDTSRHNATEEIKLPLDVCSDPARYNLKYSFTGDRHNLPLQACDDGTFTYLAFPRQTELPAIFKVLPNRKEIVVNYRMEKTYMVVETVAAAFTLRNGDQVTSIYNDGLIGDWARVKRSPE